MSLVETTYVSIVLFGVFYCRLRGSLSNNESIVHMGILVTG